jgi:plastocyanin
VCGGRGAVTHSGAGEESISMRAGIIALGVLVGGVFVAGSLAADEGIALSIKDHRFDPAEVAVPAGKKVKLVVTNHDATPEEFESHALDIEKVIPGGTTATITIGPLDPGRYEFVGEFHEDSAKGAVVVK